MTIESALAENTASNLVVAAALAANTAILEKLEAGREAAIAQLEQKSDKPARASRKKADESAAGNGDNASTGSQAGGATAVAEPTGVTEDDLRAEATAYIKGAGENADERKARAGNIKSVTDNFGTAALAGDNGIKDPTQRAQALFYLKRFAAGQPVDFSAEYDFAGDPAQGGGADSEFDGIG